MRKRSFELSLASFSTATSWLSCFALSKSYKRVFESKIYESLRRSLTCWQVINSGVPLLTSMMNLNFSSRLDVV